MQEGQSQPQDQSAFKTKLPRPSTEDYEADTDFELTSPLGREYPGKDTLLRKDSKYSVISEASTLTTSTSIESNEPLHNDPHTDTSVAPLSEVSSHTLRSESMDSTQSSEIPARKDAMRATLQPFTAIDASQLTALEETLASSAFQSGISSAIEDISPCPSPVFVQKETPSTKVPIPQTASSSEPTNKNSAVTAPPLAVDRTVERVGDCGFVIKDLPKVLEEQKVETSDKTVTTSKEAAENSTRNASKEKTPPVVEPPPPPPTKKQLSLAAYRAKRQSMVTEKEATTASMMTKSPLNSPESSRRKSELQQSPRSSISSYSEEPSFSQIDTEHEHKVEQILRATEEQTDKRISSDKDETLSMSSLSTSRSDKVTSKVTLASYKARLSKDKLNVSPSKPAPVDNKEKEAVAGEEIKSSGGFGGLPDTSKESSGSGTGEHAHSDSLTHVGDLDRVKSLVDSVLSRGASSKDPQINRELLLKKVSGRFLY